VPLPPRALPLVPCGATALGRTELWAAALFCPRGPGPFRRDFCGSKSFVKFRFGLCRARTEARSGSTPGESFKLLLLPLLD
jgi:hypothetical protein